ncbi:hypothetical protein HaLaN_09652 [Haematococcus lacustris]|uniref:Uncharacterized protein n=1 Tax=Haematococcus lacustris TaxID=44745 RepID=A0A699YWX2_HAELA|nr:hypothetical protein HaLaN_09652 [Haematococcus lacustris]
MSCVAMDKAGWLWVSSFMASCAWCQQGQGGVCSPCGSCNVCQLHHDRHNAAEEIAGCERYACGTQTKLQTPHVLRAWLHWAPIMGYIGGRRPFWENMGRTWGLHA